MSSSSTTGQRSDSAVTWCAPQIKDGDPTQISTVCFPPVGSTNMWVAVGPALMVTQMYFPATTRQAIGLSVERRPGSFAAPMKLAYVFDHWIPEAVSGGKLVVIAQVGVEMRVNGKMTPVGHLKVLPSPDHVYRMPVMGGVLTLGLAGKGGKPVALPAIAFDRKQVDALFDTLDKNSVLLAVQKPPVDKGPLPLGGMVLLAAPGAEKPSPPTLVPSAAPPNVPVVP